MKTPVRALQAGQVLHTGAGRACVLHVATIAPEARIVHLVLGRMDGMIPPAERVHVAHWPADARVQVERPAEVEWLLELARQLAALVEARDVRDTCTLIHNPPTLERKP